MTYSRVVSTLALFLALGGGSAMALGGHNTVSSDDIVNGAVKKQDLAAGAVTSAKVKNGGLRVVDLRNVVARGSAGGITTDDPANHEQAYPLSANKWTQRPGERDQIVGEAVVKSPPACAQDFLAGKLGAVFVRVRVNGKQAALASAQELVVGPNQIVRLPLVAGTTFAAPGQLASVGSPSKVTQRVLSATVKDDCVNNGENWTVQSLRLAVIGAR